MTDVSGKTRQRFLEPTRQRRLGPTALSKINASRPRGGNAESSCPSVQREPAGRCRVFLALRRQRRSRLPLEKQRLILEAERLSVCLRLTVCVSVRLHLSVFRLSVCLHLAGSVCLSARACVCALRNARLLLQAWEENEGEVSETGGGGGGEGRRRERTRASK